MSLDSGMMMRQEKLERKTNQEAIAVTQYLSLGLNRDSLKRNKK